MGEVVLRGKIGLECFLSSLSMMMATVTMMAVMMVMMEMLMSISNWPSGRAAPTESQEQTPACKEVFSGLIGRCNLKCVWPDLKRSQGLTKMVRIQTPNWTPPTCGKSLPGSHTWVFSIAFWKSRKHAFLWSLAHLSASTFHFIVSDQKQNVKVQHRLWQSKCQQWQMALWFSGVSSASVKCHYAFIMAGNIHLWGDSAIIPASELWKVTIFLPWIVILWRDTHRHMVDQFYKIRRNHPKMLHWYLPDCLPLRTSCSSQWS